MRRWQPGGGGRLQHRLSGRDELGLLSPRRFSHQPVRLQARLLHALDGLCDAVCGERHLLGQRPMHVRRRVSLQPALLWQTLQEVQTTCRRGCERAGCDDGGGVDVEDGQQRVERHQHNQHNHRPRHTRHSLGRTHPGDASDCGVVSVGCDRGRRLGRHHRAARVHGGSRRGVRAKRLGVPNTVSALRALRSHGGCDGRPRGLRLRRSVRDMAAIGATARGRQRHRGRPRRGHTLLEIQCVRRCAHPHPGPRTPHHPGATIAHAHTLPLGRGGAQHRRACGDHRRGGGGGRPHRRGRRLLRREEETPTSAERNAAHDVSRLCPAPPRQELPPPTHGRRTHRLHRPHLLPPSLTQAIRPTQQQPWPFAPSPRTQRRRCLSLGRSSGLAPRLTPGLSLPSLPSLEPFRAFPQLLLARPRSFATIDAAPPRLHPESTPHSPSPQPPGQRRP
mmetsp:Transcript_64965/g.141574  ORF Transcript_64965/g.141574 Transcript_64965/m.141574 type:complete len:448 (-) Transcript_64965:244-1587(-)